MLLTINGENRHVPQEVDNIEKLLRHLNIQRKILIIQHNDQIVSPENYASAILREGDRIELIHFVGGG
ncbi:MAG: thiamine biosynthesis protein ThiS [Bacillaceae bacterium G1]|nr:MAG: thiamine biosynthesis protein ThiS [Bacillaceae bacterium G1]